MRVRKKMVLAALPVGMAFFAVSTGVMGLLQEDTPAVRNAFHPGIVNITVDENFEPEEMKQGKTIIKQVRIKNSSTNSRGEGCLNVVPVYVRARLVATWVGEDGRTVVPVDPGKYLVYGLNLNSSSESELAKSTDVKGDWILGEDGYYYFTDAVPGDSYTDYLLETVSLKPDVTLPDEMDTGYLRIDVLADGIQASGRDSAQAAWNMSKEI